MAATIPVQSYHISQSQCVTASQLVRNFGTWHHRAQANPVYIMHHGQPRMALIGIDLLNKLSTPAAENNQYEAERDHLLAAMREMVLLLDHDGLLTAANRAARSYFEIPDPVTFGQSLAVSITGVTGDFLNNVAQRVIQSGVTERMDIQIDANRSVALTVARLPTGAALIAQDISLQEMHEQTQSALDAIDTALSTMDGVARAHINTRGMVSNPRSCLASMTKLSVDALSRVRFVSLFDIQSRVRIGEGIESVFGDQQPRNLEADLLVDGTDRHPVRVALAPIIHNLSVRGVKALIARQSA